MFRGTFFVKCHFAGKEKEKARQILPVSGGLMKAWQNLKLNSLLVLISGEISVRGSGETNCSQLSADQ